jgi:hypothetical protein
MALTLKELIVAQNLLQGQNAQTIADALNEKPLIENPVPPAEVGQPVSSMSEIFAIVNNQPREQAAADMAVILAIAQIVEAGQIIGNFLGIPAKGDAPGFVTLLQDYGMSEAIAEAIRARLRRTIPDPSWEPYINGQSLAEREGLPLVTAEAVETALAN